MAAREQQTWPKRQILYGGPRLSWFPQIPDDVPEDADRDWLDCGHLLTRPQDIYGWYDPAWRRCWKCDRQRPADFDTVALAVALREL